MIFIIAQENKKMELIKTADFKVSAEGQKRAKEMSLDEAYYDLFVGGYLAPSKFLSDPEQVELVVNAMRVVDRYLSALEQYAEEE